MDANLTDFRIVVCYQADGIMNEPDDHLHLVSNERNFKSLCDRDVKRLASISLKNWRHPRLSKIGWCGACNRRLRRIEDAMLKDVQPLVNRPSGGQWKWTPELVEHARQLFADGHSSHAAAKMMGMAYSTVRRLRAKIKANAPIHVICARKQRAPREWKPRPGLEDEVLRMLGEGRRQRDIASELHTSTGTIQKILNLRGKHGWTPNAQSVSQNGTPSGTGPSGLGTS